MPRKAEEHLKKAKRAQGIAASQNLSTMLPRLPRLTLTRKWVREGILTILVFLTLSGCSFPNSPKSEGLVQANPALSVAATSPKIVESLRPYQGKYAQDSRFLSLRTLMAELRTQAASTIAKSLGVFYDDTHSITVGFQDWQPSVKDQRYFIAPSPENGRISWHITLVVEYLLHHHEDARWLFPKAFVEAMLQEKYQERPRALPARLHKGLACYAAFPPEQVFWLLLPFLEGEHNLAEVIQKIFTDENFVELAGYWDLLYLREVYGEARLKNWIKAVVEDGSPWEAEFAKMTGSDIFSQQKNVKIFAASRLQNQYWPAVVAYRKALRAYVQERYTDAIAELRALRWQSAHDFMAGNIAFWSGMAYYRLRKYHDAAEHFQEVTEKFAHETTYLPVAFYRYALCLYEQQQIDKAVPYFADFMRDFPYHSLCGSACFFLGKCLEKKAEWRKAYGCYEQFLDKFPDNSRSGEALLCLGELSDRLGWLGHSRKYYTRLLQMPSAREWHAQAEGKMKELEWQEQMGPSEALTQKLESLVDAFPQQNLSEQQIMLDELGRIGRLALPWIERLIPQVTPATQKGLLEALSQSQSPASVPLFLKMLRAQPQLRREVVLGLLRLGLPATFVRTTLVQETADFPPASKDAILQELEALSWRTSKRLQEKFPEILRMLNGSSHEQLVMLEKLAVAADKEQIPTLGRLVCAGQSAEVKNKALEYLLAWRDTTALPVLQEIAREADPDVKLRAVEGMVACGHYPGELLQDLLNAPQPEIRLATLDIMEKATTGEPQALLIPRLGDPCFPVRDKAKQLLVRQRPQTVMPALEQAFLQENQPTVLYIGIVEILEKWSGQSIRYTPQATTEQRRQTLTTVSDLLRQRREKQ